MNEFRRLLMAAGRQPPVGTWIVSASPLVAEAVGHAGFDFGVLDMEHSPLDLGSLGFESKALGDFRNAIAAPYGMILVTGPTGSGKTTTLYSAVKEIMNPDSNFVTVEDPVEYQVDGVNQKISLSIQIPTLYRSPGSDKLR